MSNIKSKVLYSVLIFICAQFIIWTSAYIVTFKKPDVFSASGRNSISYDVVYLNNDVFSDSVRPSGTYDLLSYTDYIKITNDFTAQLSREAQVDYHYTAKETFYIKQQRTADNNTNPIVYQQEIVYKDESGELTDSRLEWSGEYDVSFDEHIAIYRKFIEDHEEMSDARDFTVEKNIQFTAELFVEFSYNIKANGLDQTFSRGISFPLSLEVYLPEFVGPESFDASVEVRRTVRNPALVLAILCLWYALNVFFICFGVKKLNSCKDARQKEIEQIFKRYSDEIIMSESEIEPDMSDYEVVPVSGFKELLKLSATTSKPILAYQDDEKVDFCVLVDGRAYCFSL